MNLFENDSHQNANILPKDGNVIYHGKVLPAGVADDYFNTLLHNIAWKNDEAMIMGKHIITKRKVAWYGDETYKYTYSKITKQALLWTPELLQLKQLSEQLTNSTYNSCLLNLYHDGSEGMAWHSDGEKTLKEGGAIASLSFGAERKFAFKHKNTGDIANIVLQHGSLLVMKDATQKNWLHRLPPTKKIRTPRINLTFRTIKVG